MREKQAFVGLGQGVFEVACYCSRAQPALTDTTIRKKKYDVLRPSWLHLSVTFMLLLKGLETSSSLSGYLLHCSACSPSFTLVAPGVDVNLGNQLSLGLSETVREGNWKEGFWVSLKYTGAQGSNGLGVLHEMKK